MFFNNLPYVQVVKVVGSNISHKLRLSSVKPSDEGSYECRVIDFSESQVQQHSVQAYVQVRPDDLLQQEHMDQKQYRSNHQLEDGEDENMSEDIRGDGDHQRIHHEIKAAQMRQEVDRFPNMDHHDHHKLNKTRTGNKHQSESRELKTHATHINSDCPDEEKKTGCENKLLRRN